LLILLCLFCICFFIFGFDCD